MAEFHLFYIGIIVIMAMIFVYRESGLRRAYDLWIEELENTRVSRINSVADVAQLKLEIGQLKRKLAQADQRIEEAYQMGRTDAIYEERSYVDVDMFAAPPGPSPVPPDLDPEPEPPVDEYLEELNNQWPVTMGDSEPVKWWMSPERPASWTTPEERKAHDKSWVTKTKDARKKEWTQAYA